MKEKVLQFLNGVRQMSPALNEHIFDLLTARNIRKGTEILKKGAICREIFYVAKGMIAGQKWQKGQWVTTWIMKEGDIVTSPQSFFDQEASTERMVAVEDCEILGITYEELQGTYDRFEEFNRHGRIITQAYYTRNLNLTDFMKRYNAKEKYRILMKEDREVIKRCPNKYLASYLNVNITTLSTIRSEVLRKG